VRRCRLHAPLLNRLNVEPPVTADFEAGQLLFFQKSIKGRAMDTQNILQVSPTVRIFASERIVSFLLQVPTFGAL
jgi:hypothetical protein